MDKYSTAKEKQDYDLKPEIDDDGKPKPFNKTIIADDAFAIIDTINSLILQLERMRVLK